MPFWNVLLTLQESILLFVTKDSEQLKIRAWVEEKLNENDSVGSFHIQSSFDEYLESLANQNKLVIDGDNFAYRVTKQVKMKK